MEELLNKIQKKKLLFTVTTGRSGTAYLAYLLGLLPGLKSEHEANPAFHDFFRGILNGEYTYMEFWTEHKLPYVASCRERFYADVSHVACKGFFESIIEMGVQPSFIFLKRKNRDVAKSLLQLQTIPLRTSSGLKYLSSPLDEGVLKIKGDLDELTDYQLCYWYTLETDRKAAYYTAYFNKNQCPQIHLSFEELTGGDPLVRLIRMLDLPPLNLVGKLKYWKNRGKNWNSKSFSKQPVMNMDWDKEESELKNRIYEEG